MYPKIKARKEVADMREAMRMQITEEAREMMSTRIEHTTKRILSEKSLIILLSSSFCFC